MTPALTPSRLEELEAMAISDEADPEHYMVGERQLELIAEIRRLQGEYEVLKRRVGYAL